MPSSLRSIVLEDETLFSYKCDRLYCKEADRGLLFSDPALHLDFAFAALGNS